MRIIYCCSFFKENKTKKKEFKLYLLYLKTTKLNSLV